MHYTAQLLDSQDDPTALASALSLGDTLNLFDSSKNRTDYIDSLYWSLARRDLLLIERRGSLIVATPDTAAPSSAKPQLPKSERLDYAKQCIITLNDIDYDIACIRSKVTFDNELGDAYGLGFITTQYLISHCTNYNELFQAINDTNDNDKDPTAHIILARRLVNDMCARWPDSKTHLIAWLRGVIYCYFSNSSNHETQKRVKDALSYRLADNVISPKSLLTYELHTT